MKITKIQGLPGEKHLCLEGGPKGGKKPIVTLQPCLIKHVTRVCKKEDIVVERRKPIYLSRNPSRNWSKEDLRGEVGEGGRS